MDSHFSEFPCYSVDIVLLTVCFLVSKIKTWLKMQLLTKMIRRGVFRWLQNIKLHKFHCGRISVTISKSKKFFWVMKWHATVCKTLKWQFWNIFFCFNAFFVKSVSDQEKKHVLMTKNLHHFGEKRDEKLRTMSSYKPTSTIHLFENHFRWKNCFTRFFSFENGSVENKF